jgi:hypothetical protein
MNECDKALTELKLLKTKAVIDALLEGTKGTLAHFVLLHRLDVMCENLDAKPAKFKWALRCIGQPLPKHLHNENFNGWALVPHAPVTLAEFQKDRRAVMAALSQRRRCDSRLVDVKAELDLETNSWL